MTITLDWWMIPVIMLIAASVIFIRTGIGIVGDYDFDLTRPFIATLLFVGAICLTIGHFL